MAMLASIYFSSEVGQKGRSWGHEKEEKNSLSLEFGGSFCQQQEQ